MGSPGSCLKPANSGIWTLQDAASIVYPPCSEAQASERRNAEPVDGLPCLLLDRACNVTTSDPHSDAAVERAISVDHIGRGDVIHLSKAFCKCLVAASVLPGEVVTICMPNAAELVPVFLGTALARAIAAPLDSACTAHEFEQSNTASRSRAVVLFAGDVRTQELQYLARKIGLSVCSVKLEIEHQSMDGNAAHRLQASWLSRAEPCLPAENNGVSSGIHPTDRLCSEDDVALLLHMPSAMSGELKMERVTHGQLVRHAVRLAALYDLTTHDTTMLLMPFSHAGGLVATFLASFVAGCPVLVPRLADAPSLFSLIARHRISWYAAAPALHHMLLEQAEAHPEQLWPAGQLRFVCSIGGSLDAAQMARMNALLRARVVTLPSQCAGLLQPPEASTQVAVPVDAAGNERPHPSHAHVAGNPAARVSSACRGLDTHSSGRTTLTEEAAANVEKDPLGCPAEQLGGQVGPRDVLEARLQEIVQDLLGASQTVSVLANFFHFGMSLAATVRLASVIRQQFRDVIPGADCMQVATVLTHASIAELAEALRQGCGTRPALASEQTQSIHHGQPSPRSHSSPVSFGQDQMLALHELDPTSPAYNMSIWWSVAGHVDVDRLRRSIQVVVGRHDVLRYIFASNPDVPPGHMGAGCQLAVPAADFTVPCEVWDCRREPGEAGQAKDALLQTWAARPFDLYSGPLLRVLLLIKSDVAASLVVSMHHSVGDGPSRELLGRELSECYSAFSEGQPPCLPLLPVQYSDFALWQRRWLEESGEMAAQLTYWKGHLADAPQLLELPTDKPRPRVQSFAGGSVHVRLDEGLVQGLRAVGAQHGATFLMVLTALWAALLGRCSRQDKVVVGTPWNGRSKAEVQHLIGYFINPLALCVDVDGELPFSRMVQHVRDVVLAAMEHADAPFHKVVQAVGSTGVVGHNPIFQSMVVPNDFADGNPLPLGSDCLLHPQFVQQGSSTSKVDVSLVLTGDPGSADQLLLLEYRTDLWCEASMQRLGQQLVCLASSAVASPETPVGRLPMMTEAERRRVVEEWNATDTAFACAGKCLHELFDEQVSRTPDHVAVETETEHVTYREVQQRADALACCLRDAGVVVDGRVGLCLKGCAEMVVGMLAILKAGCAYVPLDPEYPAERVQGMLEDADVSILLTSPHQQPPWGADTFGHLKQLEVPLTPAYAPDLPAQKRVIHRKVFPTDLAYVLFTSGTTGRPKGVMVEHYNVCNLVACVIDRWQLDSSSRVLQLANPSFDASVAEVFGTLAAGGTLVVHPVGSDLQDSLRRVTCAFAVPSVLSMFNPAHFPGLSTICTGGEMVPLHMATSWAAGRRCLIGYGPTECCVMVTMGQMTAEDQSVSIGGPLPNVRAYVLDAYLQPTNIGVPGELYIGGAGVARGYANRNDLTKEKFLDNPFAAGRLYRTGDLARWLPDGRLQCLGRLDRQVKLSGVRIELGEVEGVLEACPGVAKAVAILQDVRGRADGPVSSSKRLVAYVAPANVQVDALVEAARRKLPSYMVPSAVVALERFPVTISGKVDLRALPPVDLSTSGGRAYVPPRSVYEARVQAVCQDVLGVASLSVLASFHEFGINSLMAMALVHQMRERLAEFPGAGEGLRVTTVLANPSVAELAAVMTCGRQVATRPADMAARCQEEALSFSQLDGAAGLLSAALAASGVGAEMRVAIVMERSLLLLAAMLGVLKAGACYVSLDPANPPAYLASLLDAASITAILWDRAVCGRLQGMAGLEQTTCFVVDDLVADARTASGTGGGRGLNQDFSVGPFIHADQAAVCLFSSGSSGVPKGVELTHRALVAKLEGYWAACPFRLGEACLARTTVSFVDHTLEILGSLLHGVPVVLATAQEARDPASLLHVVASAHITRLVVVPSLLQAMLADTQEDERVRAMWREGLLSLVISSGEPLPLSLAQAFLAAAGDHCQLVNLYGSTETCGDATWAPVTRAMVAAGHVTVGHPLLRAVTLVLDDHGQLAPPGVPGELCVGGGVVARGYLHQPELTASRFTRIPIGDLLGGDAAALPASRFPQHPVSDMFTPSPDEAASGKDDRPSLVLYRTGDCARLLPCGDLALMGRLDHQVKVRGVRLELGFVEQAMARLPGVAAAGAVLVPATQQGLADAAGHDTLVAVVSPRRLLPEALLAALGQQLPQYALPARILCEDELPRLISGKLDRRKLLAMAAAEMAEMRRVGTGGGGREAPTSHAAVRMDPLEAKLAALWGKVLRLPSVSVFDDFFNIGGNSLVAVQLQRELAREMVRDPALAPLASGDRHLSVFSHRTISSMAAEAASALGRTAGRGASGTSDNRHAFRGAAAAASLMFRPQSLFACLLGPASSSSGAEPATSGEEHALSGVLEVVTSNLRFLWSFSVVMLHFGHCGGQNLRCFQNTPLAGLWAPHDNTSLANFVPRAFQGGVLGLSILSGMGAASGGMRPSLRTPVLAVILALLMEFGVSRAFDDLVRSSPQERFSTTAHLWGLWALAFNQLLLWLCVGLWRSHTRREGPSYRNGGVVLLLLAAGTMQFLLPILFALLWPPASAAGVRGMWFGPWGMHQLGWEPLGPRILTSALPFAIGYAYNSQITRLVHTGRSHVWLRVALAAIFVQLTVRSTFFPDILAGLDLRSSEAARFATVADVMATWELGLWWREWPLRVLGCMGALAEDMVMAFAMLAIMPALDGTVTRFGRASLPIYLFHPHVLRLMEPFSFWLLRQVSSNMPLTVMLEVLLPLSSTVCLCLAFAAMQRRGLGIGKTVIGLSIVLHVLKRALV
eukprot:jgi/Mesvir1/5869/Mv00649-RA.6